MIEDLIRRSRILQKKIIYIYNNKWVSTVDELFSKI